MACMNDQGLTNLHRNVVFHILMSISIVYASKALASVTVSSIICMYISCIRGVRMLYL